VKKIALISIISISSLFGFNVNKDGLIRAMYIENDSKKLNAFAFGGRVAGEVEYDNFKVRSGFFYSSALNERDDARAKFFINQNSSYSLLGEASISYTNDELSIIILGRQCVRTPFVDADDGRIIPNLYSGLSLKYLFAQNSKIETYYLNKMAGFWNTIYSGRDMSKFDSIENATGYGDIVDSSGLYIFGVSHNLKNDRFKFFNYYGDNLINIIYGEYQHDFKLKNVDFTFYAQSSRQDDVGSLKNHLSKSGKNLKQNYGGVKLEATYDKIIGYFAIAKVSNSNGELDKSLMSVWGGIPHYTVCNENVMRTVNADGVLSSKSSLKYRFTKKFDTTFNYLYYDVAENLNSPDKEIKEFIVAYRDGMFFVNWVLILWDMGKESDTTLKSTIEYKF